MMTECNHITLDPLTRPTKSQHHTSILVHLSVVENFHLPHAPDPIR